MEPIPAHGAAAGEAHVAAVQHKLSQFMKLLPGMDSTGRLVPGRPDRVCHLGSINMYLYLLPGMEEWHPMSAEMAEVLLVMLGLGLRAP